MRWISRWCQAIPWSWNVLIATVLHETYLVQYLVLRTRSWKEGRFWVYETWQQEYNTTTTVVPAAVCMRCCTQLHYLVILESRNDPPSHKSGNAARGKNWIFIQPQWLRKSMFRVSDTFLDSRMFMTVMRPYLHGTRYIETWKHLHHTMGDKGVLY